MSKKTIEEQEELEVKFGLKSFVKTFVERVLELSGLSQWLSYSKVASNVIFVFFLVTLGVIHIANTHMAERTVREINAKEKEIRELRWEYISLKSDLMYNSKQSELAEQLKADGIYELTQPPYKIDARNAR